MASYNQQLATEFVMGVFILSGTGNMVHLATTVSSNLWSRNTYVQTSKQSSWGAVPSPTQSWSLDLWYLETAQGCSEAKGIQSGRRMMEPISLCRMSKTVARSHRGKVPRYFTSQEQRSSFFSKSAFRDVALGSESQVNQSFYRRYREV